MGANLCLTVVVKKETKRECLKRINKLDWSDIEGMVNGFESAGIWISNHDKIADEELVRQMKERLKQAVEVVYDSVGSRNVDSIYVHGLGSLLITGGLTWGDDPTEEFADFDLFNFFLGYPYWSSPKSSEVKEWHKIGKKRATKTKKPKKPKKCRHPHEKWNHHTDGGMSGGDWYTCGVCGEITQVG